MLATSLIVFRETLEAALLVGVLAAATRHVPRVGRWLGLGVGVGLAGALCLAAGLARISLWAEGMGQEWMNVIILSAALLLLAWHCIWMSAQGRDRAQAARQLGDAAARGQRSLWALALVVALAVLREGAESVLFVAGLLAGSQEAGSSVLIGAGLGMALGIAAGGLLFAGLRVMTARQLFALTQGLVLLLAGGLASQLAKALNQADWLPLGSERVWDLSASLPNDSALGLLLHGTLGYDASPMLSQLVFYGCAVGLIALMSHRVKRQVRLGSRQPAALATPCPPL